MVGRNAGSWLAAIDFAGWLRPRGEAGGQWQHSYHGAAPSEWRSCVVVRLQTSRMCAYCGATWISCCLSWCWTSRRQQTTWAGPARSPTSPCFSVRPPYSPVNGDVVSWVSVALWWFLWLNVCKTNSKKSIRIDKSMCINVDNNVYVYSSRNRTSVQEDTSVRRIKQLFNVYNCVWKAWFKD